MERALAHGHDDQAGDLSRGNDAGRTIDDGSAKFIVALPPYQPSSGAISLIISRS